MDPEERAQSAAEYLDDHPDLPLGPLKLRLMWHQYGEPDDLTDFCNRQDVWDVLAAIDAR